MHHSSSLWTTGEFEHWFSVGLVLIIFSMIAGCSEDQSSATHGFPHAVDAKYCAIKLGMLRLYKTDG